jgi:hypothetical protein
MAISVETTRGIKNAIVCSVRFRPNRAERVAAILANAQKMTEGYNYYSFPSITVFVGKGKKKWHLYERSIAEAIKDANFIGTVTRIIDERIIGRKA